jgi:uncharacterized damage-inducible protein DinB
MNVESLRTLFEYNCWAHRRVWSCVLQTDDAHWTQPVSYSLGTLQIQYVHVLSVDQRWFARLRGDELPVRLEPSEFATRERLWQAWEESEAAHRAYLQSASDADLQSVIEFDMPHRGGLKRTARWEIVVHVVNHGTDHRGQILATLHMIGAPTVEQDMMFYLWER